MHSPEGNFTENTDDFKQAELKNNDYRIPQGPMS